MSDSHDPDVALVVPVYRNGPSLPELVRRVDAALDGRRWVLRLVVDACPDGSLQVAQALAEADPRVRVTHLTENVGQHLALARGLSDEASARAWVLLDGDLQDPPEAVPGLVQRLRPGTSGVFAGRRGAYQSRGRRVTGDLHRLLLAALTGLPTDAGAFFALDTHLRDGVLDAVLRRGAPSVVAAAGRTGLRVVSVPVPRDVRLHGSSAWTSQARLRQSLATLGYCVRDLRRRPALTAAA